MRRTFITTTTTPIAPLTLLAPLLLLSLGGCDDARSDSAAPAGSATAAAKPVPGSFVQEAGFSTKFYAEELEKNKLFLFGRKASHNAFIEGGRKIKSEKMRTIPAGGPEAVIDGAARKTTLMFEYTPDEPAMENRLRKTVATRYSLPLSFE